MSVAEDLYVSPAEYLARERLSPFRSEYINGRIYAMSGGTSMHGMLAINCGGALLAALDDRPCQAYSSDVRVKVPDTALYTYPDLSVVCGEPEFDDETRDTLTNPIIVVEVLSPTTEAYDRGDKFAHYERLATLRHYVLIAQDRPRVEVFSRQSIGEPWLWEVTESLDGEVRLDAIGCSLPMSRLYRRAKFTPNPTAPVIA